MQTARDRTHAPRERDAYMTIDQRVIPALLLHFKPRGRIWEPACGTGEMVARLARVGHAAVGTDISFGASWNFLTTYQRAAKDVETIITNPPNKLNLDFVRHALKLMEPVRGAVAIYQRHEWDTTKKTAEIFEHPAFAMKIVPRFRPIWIAPEPGKKASSPFHKWSWYVWDWKHKGAPVVRFA